MKKTIIVGIGILCISLFSGSTTLNASTQVDSFEESLRNQLVGEGYTESEITDIIDLNNLELDKANTLNDQAEEDVLNDYTARKEQLYKTKSVTSDEAAFAKINPKVFDNKENYEINYSTGEFSLNDKDDLFSTSGTRSAFSDMQIGDFLVNHSSPSNSSKNFIGHAAIVETKGSTPSTSYTMEAYGKGFQPYGGYGVKRFNYNTVWHSDMKSKQSFNYVPSKYSASISTANRNAALYARAKDGVPYNYNFLNVNTTSSFYCSQLVYRAWLEHGINLNQGGGIVSPVDLYQDTESKAYYTQNF